MLSLGYLFETVKILDFPDTRQSDYESCGVAATQGVAVYYGIDKPEDYFKGKDKHKYQCHRTVRRLAYERLKEGDNKC